MRDACDMGRRYLSLAADALFLAALGGLFMTVENVHAQGYVAQGFYQLVSIDARDRLSRYLLLMALTLVPILLLSYERDALARRHPRWRHPLSAGILILVGGMLGWAAEYAEAPFWTNAASMSQAVSALLGGRAEGIAWNASQRGVIYSGGLMASAFLLRGVWRSDRPRPPSLPFLGKLRSAALFLTGAGVLVAFAAPSAFLLADPPHSRGVVLIVVDTLRADHLGAYGASNPTSPALDRFMRHASRYENAVAAAPWTTPSTAALLTSRYPSEVAWTNPPAPIPPRVPMLAELFLNKGYRTAAFVSHHYVASELNFDQGYQQFDDSNARDHAYVSSPSITAMARRFLEADADVPFFLMLHYFDPHFDYILHQPYDFDPSYEGRVRSGEGFVELQRDASAFDAADLAQVEALYDSEIRYMDDFIGAVFDTLRSLGLYDHVTIVFTADHGEEFFDRGTRFIGHGHSLYQELLHVPLAVKYAGQREGRVIRDRVSLLDVVPTLVDACGLDAPRGGAFRGRLLPRRSTGREAPRPVFSEMSRSAEAVGRYEQSVIYGDWKLIRTVGQDNIRLYNLDRDPGEHSNDALDRPERVQALTALLDAWERDLTPFGDTGSPPREDAFSAEQKDLIRALGYVQ